MTTNNDNLIQNQRITAYEALFDALVQLHAINEAIIYDPTFQKGFKQLVDYYQSSLWMNDFDDDHNGLIPKNIKRGILSEDGIFNFLVSVNQEIFALIDNTNGVNS